MNYSLFIIFFYIFRIKEFIDDPEFTEIAGQSMPSHYNRFSSSLTEIIPNEFNFETSTSESSNQYNFNASMSHICPENTCPSELQQHFQQPKSEFVREQMSEQPRFSSVKTESKITPLPRREMATQLKDRTSAQANYIKSTANNLHWKQLAHNDNRHLAAIELFDYSSIEQSQRIDSLFRDLLKR